MNVRDQLLYMLDFNRKTIKKLIDDVSEEESMERGSDSHNHIRWTTGHLVYCDSYVCSLLGGDSDDHKKVAGLFGAGSEVSDDPSAYPAMSELRERLYRLHEWMISRIEKLTDADLERETGDDENKEPLWQPVTFFCMHEFYHAGQMASMRRLLGRDRPFN